MNATLNQPERAMPGALAGEIERLKRERNAVLLAHNHPSGNTEPSAADRALTARLKAAMGLVDVRLLDHFIVTATETVSMAARGQV